MNISIVGGGIIALSTAYRLISSDKNITINIICDEKDDNSASISAGAMISCFTEVTKDTFNKEHGKTKFEFTLAALKKWQKWIKEINTQVPEDMQISITYGTYLILNTVSGLLDCENYQHILDSLKKYNEDFHEVKHSDIPGFNSIESMRPTSAIFVPNEGIVNPISVINALKYILKLNNNVSFINQRVKHVNASKEIILSNKSKIQSDKILIAAGSGSYNILKNIDGLRYRIPHILSGAGYAIEVNQDKTSPLTHLVRTPNRSGACGLHALPYTNNTLYIGATNGIFSFAQNQAKIGLLQFLINCGIQQINQDLYNTELVKVIVGNRPASIDGFPLIGELLSIKNIYVLAGTYRDGFTQSPYLSEYITNLMINDVKDNKINNLFNPERKLIKAFSSQEESINETVHHYIAGLYEHKMSIPSLMSETTFKNMLRDKLSSIYARLDKNCILPPDILFLFILSENDDKTFEYYKNYISNNYKEF